MIGRLLHGWAGLLAAAIGLAFCWVWAGPAVLDPMSTGWLQVGDRAMHTLGWWFFREAPWGWPPGRSPLLGLELSSSVALSDSLPLFAFPFKLMAAWLPARFQYWGLWFLLSFALQGLFGYLVGRELGLGRPAALLAALFCVIEPAFLDRIGGHMALGGHWTILAALYLYVRRRPPGVLAWPILLATTSAIHGYLLAMCLGIWVAALAQRLWIDRSGWRRLALEAGLAMALAGAVLWATGTFMVSSLDSGGYGIFRMNLLSVFDSAGWSHIWPDLPQEGGDYEGMNFPGIGIALLAILVLVMRFRAIRQAALGRRWLPLLALSGGLTLFAISNYVGFAADTLVTIPLPEPVGRLAQVFRSSGRMFWPVGYLILFTAVLFSSRVLGRHAVPVLALLLVGQAVDSSAKWMGFRGVGERGASWEQQLPDPAWQALGEHYQRVRGLPVKLLNPDWMALSYFALEHGIGTDAAYLGRIDARRFAELTAREEQAMASGALEPDTIYVMDLASALKVAPHLGPDDLMARIDGRMVFARGGARVLAQAGLEAERFEPRRHVLPVGVPQRITGEVAERYLLEGWSGVEDWGIWTEGEHAAIGFRTEAAGPLMLKLRATGFAPRRGAKQQVDVLVNGAFATHLSLGQRMADYAIPLPAMPPGSDVSVELLILEPRRPADRVGTGDIRLLGVGLETFELVPDEGAAP